MAGGAIEGIVPDAYIEAVLGESTGSGSVREAHAYVGEPDRIVKVSRSPLHASNWTEWNLWNQVAETHLTNVMGRCFAISESGQYLVMERLDDLKPNDKENPVSCPSWVTDRKPSAFGLSANGQIKLRDYGQVTLLSGRGQLTTGAALAGAPVVSLSFQPDEQMASWLKAIR